VPATVGVKVIAVMGLLLQIVCVAGFTVTVGIGFTVMVAICTVPVQPLAVGTTVMVSSIGALVGLSAVNELILVVPVAPRLILVLLFVQA